MVMPRLKEVDQDCSPRQLGRRRGTDSTKQAWGSVRIDGPSLTHPTWLTGKPDFQFSEMPNFQKAFE